MNSKNSAHGTDPSAGQDTLADWLLAEDALRAGFAANAGVAPLTHQDMVGLDGLSIMRAMLAGRAKRPAIGITLDFLPVEFEPGRAVFQGAPGAAHLNPMGTVHGGWYATMLDSALGCSVHCALPVGKSYTTLELKVNIVRALGPQVQRVRAEGQVIHVGKQTATAEARLLGPDGKLYAHGSTTCLVFDTQKLVAPNATAIPHNDKANPS
jgi:uncharacterized protein (TIGR00369 family)